MSNSISVAILFVAIVIVLAMPSPLLRGVGESDFRAYWSASYLLTHGENFADPQRLFAVERGFTGWRENYPMVTWNPPWLLVILAPLTLVSFRQAVWWWLLTNVALAFSSSLVIWNLSVSQANVRRFIWLPLLILVAYSPVLTAIAAGQVSILVLAGISGFLFFDSRQQDVSSGAALAVTLVKPQLVYLVVPILLVNLLLLRRWRAFAGFSALLLMLSVTVFLLRPGFLTEYLTTLGNGNLLNYQTPTLAGWLEMQFGWSWAPFIGLALVPLGVIICRRYRGDLPISTLVDIGLLLSVVMAPFAWSYDFVVLLIPLIRMAGWIADGKLAKPDSIAIILILVIADAIMLYQRFNTDGEINFVWIPLFLAAIYMYVYRRLQSRLGSMTTSPV